MGLESIVYGYIVIPDNKYIEYNRQAIATFPFDEEYPFTNIFWLDSPAQYFFPLIGLTGSYKGIEDHWNEWLWKFSQLLSRLEAIEAQAHLDCIYGCLGWELKPRSVFERQPPPATLIGQQWGITKAPPNDFSIDPIWPRNVMQLNAETGKLEPYRWDKFVERWTKHTSSPAQAPKKWWQLWR